MATDSKPVELKKGECGGQSCTPEMEERMLSQWPGQRLSIRETVQMQRGVARNQRVIRKPNVFM